MDPGCVLIIAFVVFGMVAGGITVLVEMVRNPPRPAGWRPNPVPGRGPYWDRGRSWTDVVGRATLVAIATMFFIIPGVLLLTMGLTSSQLGRR